MTKRYRHASGRELTEDERQELDEYREQAANDLAERLGQLNVVLEEEEDAVIRHPRPAQDAPRVVGDLNDPVLPQRTFPGSEHVE